VIPSLELMIGKQSKHPVEWNYLNKGTHEEDKDEEFDSTIVKEMLLLLIEMDTAIETGGTVVAMNDVSGPISKEVSENIGH
jgi:hypothetical protein